MRNTILFPFILAAALTAAACGSSEPETVTSATPSDEPSQAATPAEGEPADGSSADGGDAPGSDETDEGQGGASSGEDSGASSSSSSDEADASSPGGSADDGTGAVSEPVPDSPDDTVSVTPDQIVGDGADISDPGPSNSGEPVPPQDQRMLAHVRNVAFQVLESWPAQVIVDVSGGLPDPCHYVWWEVAVDGTAYDVKVWAVSPPPGAEIACAAVEEPFAVNIPLGGGFVDDDYTVIVNGESHPLSF